MNLDKYTQKSQEAVVAAQRLAQDYQLQLVEPGHLLLALVQQQDGIVRAIITKVSGGTQALQEELSSELDQKPKVQVGLCHCACLCDCQTWLDRFDPDGGSGVRHAEYSRQCCLPRVHLHPAIGKSWYAKRHREACSHFESASDEADGYI